MARHWRVAISWPFQRREALIYHQTFESRSRTEVRSHTAAVLSFIFLPGFLALSCIVEKVFPAYKGRSYCLAFTNKSDSDRNRYSIANIGNQFKLSLTLLRKSRHSCECFPEPNMVFLHLPFCLWRILLLGVCVRGGACMWVRQSGGCTGRAVQQRVDTVSIITAGAEWKDAFNTFRPSLNRWSFTMPQKTQWNSVLCLT